MASRPESTHLFHKNGSKGTKKKLCTSSFLFNKMYLDDNTLDALSLLKDLEGERGAVFVMYRLHLIPLPAAAIKIISASHFFPLCRFPPSCSSPKVVCGNEICSEEDPGIGLK